MTVSRGFPMHSQSQLQPHRPPRAGQRSEDDQMRPRHTCLNVTSTSLEKRESVGSRPQQHPSLYPAAAIEALQRAGMVDPLGLSPHRPWINQDSASRLDRVHISSPIERRVSQHGSSVHDLQLRMKVTPLSLGAAHNRGQNTGLKTTEDTCHLDISNSENRPFPLLATPSTQIIEQGISSKSEHRSTNRPYWKRGSTAYTGSRLDKRTDILVGSTDNRRRSSCLEKNGVTSPYLSANNLGNDRECRKIDALSLGRPSRDKGRPKREFIIRRSTADDCSSVCSDVDGLLVRSGQSVIKSATCHHPRTIAATSLRASKRSPPPPIPFRSSTPKTPRQSSQQRIIPACAAPVESDGSSPPSKELLTRSTRPARRSSQGPCQTPQRSMEEDKVHSRRKNRLPDPNRGDLFRDIEGLQWEMLNEVQASSGKAKKEETLSSTCESFFADKWTDIDEWRKRARQPKSGPEQGEVTSASDETLLLSPDIVVNDEYLDNNKGEVSALPSYASACSIQNADSFQSMSSIALSLITAPSEVANDYECKEQSRASSSTSPFDNERHRGSHELSSLLPGYLPREISSQAPGHLLHCNSDRRSMASLQVSPAQENVLHQVNSSPAYTHTSGEYESADEGSITLTPTFSPNSQLRSPHAQHSQRIIAHRRASRLIGGSENLHTGARMRPSSKQALSFQLPIVTTLTAAQLMTLSEEAEAGDLQHEDLQRRHDELLKQERDMDQVLPTSLKRSPAQQTTKQINSQVIPIESSCLIVGLTEEVKGPYISSETPTKLLEDGESEKLTVHVASHPTRPRRRLSKRHSHVAQAASAYISQERVHPFFLKLDSLPIQLVEVPTLVSWRTTISTEQYKSLAQTFGTREMHRQEVIEELSVTEWNFVVSVNSILRIFSLPLRNSNMAFRGDVPIEVARLFNWLDDILAFHVKLLRAIDKVKLRHPSALVVSLASSLNRHISGLSIHQAYLASFERVTKLIETLRRSPEKGDLATFDSILEQQCNLPECRGMVLSSFLLKPVQRLMKYPLFFKQLAELTPPEHPDHKETVALSSTTEKLIREMNCVKADEEDCQELKLLEGRLQGLPQGLVVASRQRRLLKQGPLRSISFEEMQRLQGNFSSLQGGSVSPSTMSVSPPTTASYFRPMSLIGSRDGSLSPCMPQTSQAWGVTDDGAKTPPIHLSSTWSPSPSDGSSQCESTNSVNCSAPTTSYLSEKRKTRMQQRPPPRPRSRKTSMATLFHRSQSQSKVAMCDDQEGDHLYAFVFDDMLILTTVDQEDEKVLREKRNKGTKINRKSLSSSKATSTARRDDETHYTVLPQGGVSRVLGVTNRSVRDDAGSLVNSIIELEVLPLNKTGDTVCPTGSSGSLTFFFNFGGGGSANLNQDQEICLAWERTFETSFVSCIQSRRNESKKLQQDLTSPLFGGNPSQRKQTSLTTAQSDWFRRRRHVTDVVLNAARCGDRATLDALLQAGLPFPRSPSQLNLCDIARRTVAIVERDSASPADLQPQLESHAEARTLEARTLRKSPSLLQTQSSKKTHALLSTYIADSFNVDEIARIGDLGHPSTVARILDEDRREEKTWWSLRLMEIEAEARLTEELERLMASRRARREEDSLKEPSTNASTSGRNCYSPRLPVSR